MAGNTLTTGGRTPRQGPHGLEFYQRTWTVESLHQMSDEQLAELLAEEVRWIQSRCTTNFCGSADIRIRVVSDLPARYHADFMFCVDCNHVYFSPALRSLDELITILRLRDVTGDSGFRRQLFLG